jgi:hypothetical protein
MIPKSIKLADLKRIKPGRKLRLVHSLLGPCDKQRVVVSVNTVGMQLTGDGLPEGRVSYLYWPKASELVGDQSCSPLLE